MNVLRLSPHYYFETKNWPSEYDPLGGMQTQITCFSERMAKKGINQTVITSGYPGVVEIKQKNLNVIPVSKYIVKIKSRIGGLVCFDLFWLIGLINWLIKNRKRMIEYDVVHNHYSGTYASILASLIIGQFFKNEQIITIHCSRNFTYIPPSFCSRIFNGQLKKIEKKMIDNAKKVIVLTNSQKEKYMSINVSEEKIEVIGDSIPDYHLNMVQVEEENWFKYLNDSKRKIAFVGRISYEKGCEVLIDIAKRMKDKEVRFFVVGDGPQREEFEKNISDNNLKDKFIISGFVSKFKIPYILSKIDVLVVPSRHEEFGSVILEGIIANKPIVTSGVGGITNILGDNYNGIVGDDIDLYVKKINDYLSGKLTPNYSKDEIIQCYDLDNNINKMIKIYEA